MQVKRAYHVTRGLNTAVLAIIGILSLVLIYKSIQMFVPKSTQGISNPFIQMAFENIPRQALITAVPLVDYVFSTEANNNTAELKYKNSYFNQLFSLNFPLIDYVMQYESMEYKTAVEIYPSLLGETALPEDGLESLKELPDDTYTVYQPVNTNNQPTVYTREQLLNFNFLINNFYIINPTLKALPEDFPVETFLDMDLSMNINKDKPQVLIYHTHAMEEFIDSRRDYSDKNFEKYLPEDTVVGVGAELTRILEEDYGVNVIHHTDVYDLINGKFDRSKAYSYARTPIKKILDENPSIQVVIDLHRDGVREDVRLATTIDGRPTAKIMLFNGISKTMKDGKMVDITQHYNPYKTENFAFSFQLQLKAAELFPTFTRKIYIKDYRYNLDFLPRAMLLEVGAQTNTVEEAKNAMIPFAKILMEVLKGN